MKVRMDAGEGLPVHDDAPHACIFERGLVSLDEPALERRELLVKLAAHLNDGKPARSSNVRLHFSLPAGSVAS